jgi:hypothetical protein
VKLLQLPPGEPVVELHRTAYTAEGLVVECAIGLGSHDLGVADTAVDLYSRGLASVLLFTGATSPTTRERMPRGEAVHYRERALELGVPETAVLVEPRARNTGENIRFSRGRVPAEGG